MVQLKIVEETAERLTFRVSALPMIGHMSLLTFIACAVTAAVTLFTRRWIGAFLSFTFVTLPGVLCAACGVWGCCNARSFTFTFDRSCGEFVAAAGTATLTVPLNSIILIYIEREIDSGSGGFIGQSAPTYSVTLLLMDGKRCHLEGGVPMTGSDRGPLELHGHCDKIQEFLDMPRQLALLELTKSAKPEPAENDPESQERLSRWLSCSGISPKLEPALYEYPWLEPPEGVGLPPLGIRPIGHSNSGLQFHSVPVQRLSSHHSHLSHGSGSLIVQDRWASASAGSGTAVMGHPPTGGSGPGAVVMGRVAGQSQPRFLQVVVPQGMQGQNMMVMTPDGTQLSLVVPQEAVAGQPITLQY